jgi:hypothetical protein
MPADPKMDQLAAQVRQSLAAKPPMQATMRLVEDIAAALREDAPDLSDEQIGRVILMVSVDMGRLTERSPTYAKSGVGVANILSMIGAHLYAGG